MKNFYRMGIVLLALLSLSMGVSAKDVAVKWSGPAGMGDLIYYSPLTGLTNMVMGSNGVEVLNIDGALTIVGDVSLTGTLTADAIEASATNITAGTVLNAVAGQNVTNLNGAHIASGDIAEERISNALVNATTVGDAATVLAGVGTAITAINAANVSAATSISAINGAAITNLNGANIASGDIAVARIATALTTPGAIGGTTPAAGAFTTLESSGAYTLGIGGVYTGVFNIVGTTLTFVVNGTITNVLDADITSP